MISLKKIFGCSTAVLGIALYVLTQSATAQTGNCTYSISNEWSTGYTGAITINNNGTNAINNWSINWQYNTNRITSSWNAALSGDNPYTANSLSWNRSIAPGASVQVGLQVDKNGGATETPIVNGEVCSSTSSSSVASSTEPAMCNWYGSFYPYCDETQQGWGWENGRSCVSETTCNLAPCTLANCSSAFSSSSSVNSASSGFSSSSVDYGSCPFTGVECVSLSGTWEYICAPGCNSQGPASCISANMCRTYGSSATTSSSSSPASSIRSGSSSSCPFTGHECVTNTGGWAYICAPGCSTQGGQGCVSISRCGFNNTSSSSSTSSSYGSSRSSSSSAISAVSSSMRNSNAYRLKDLADFPVGVAVSAGTENNSLFGSSSSAGRRRGIIERDFDQVTAGNTMKMSYLHPSENVYTFEHADQLVSYALERNISIHGHTLVWHSDYQVPTWMKNYTGDYSSMLQEHVQTIASYYAGRVVSWDVVNEAFADDGDSTAVNGYRNSLWYQTIGPAYIEQAFITANAADPSALLYYNDYNIEGGQQKFQHVLAMADDFKARDIPIDGIGFQMHINIEWPSDAQIRNAFQQVVQRGLKVKITELDVPVNTHANPNRFASFTEEAELLQQAKYREVVAAYLDIVPPELRGGITVWGIVDSESWLIDLYGRPDWPLLFKDGNPQPKLAMDGIMDALLMQ